MKYSSEDRYDRLLLIFEYAYALLALVGSWAEYLGYHRPLMTNTSNKRTISLWRLGKEVLSNFAVFRKDLLIGLERMVFVQ